MTPGEWITALAALGVGGIMKTVFDQFVGKRERRVQLDVQLVGAAGDLLDDLRQQVQDLRKQVTDMREAHERDIKRLQNTIESQRKRIKELENPGSTEETI